MNNIVVSLNGQPKEEIEKIDGVIMSVPLDALLPHISEYVRLRPYELIDGLVISDTDIRVKISRKRGREVKAEAIAKEAALNNGTPVKVTGFAQQEVKS